MTANWATSASTCEKSGLAVAFTVTFGVTPQRTEAPKSAFWLSLPIGPDGKSDLTSVRWAVTVGSTSTLRPGFRSAKPETLVIWQRMHARSRSRRLPEMRCRTFLGYERLRSNPQVIGVELEGNRIWLSGIAISTM